MYKRYLIYIFLLQSIFGSSQTYRFKHITSEEGLPTNYVQTIIEDRKGFMWFGTQEGLCRYDGYNIEVFKHSKNKTTSLSSSNILYLYEHTDDKIYIGTRNAGLNIYDPKTKVFELITVGSPKERSLTDPRITWITKDDDESIWVATGNGINLVNVKTKAVKHYLFPGDNPVFITCMYKFHDKLFVGTSENGIWVIKKNEELKQITLVNASSNELNLNTASNLSKISEYAGKIYASTSGEGVIMFDPETYEIEKNYKVKSASLDRVNNALAFEIKDNKLFTCTSSGFVIDHLITNEKEVLRHDGDKKGLNDNQINCVYLDSKDNIWLGTFSGGVNISFSQAKKFPSLSSDISNLFKLTYSLLEDKQGLLWIGGEKSLKTFNRKTNEIKDYSSVVGINHALSMIEDKQENIWIGTWGGGIIRYNKKTKSKENILKKEGRTSTVLSFYLADNGDVWAGTFEEGLFICDTKTGEIRHYTTADGLSSNSITSVIKDPTNIYWIGTIGGGIMGVKNADFKPQNIRVFKNTIDPNSLSSDNIYSLYLDTHKNIWCATEFGLNKINLDAGKITNYTEEDGLANNFAYSVIPDSSENLWISTNKGISKFNPSVSNVNGSAFKNYDQNDGLLNTEYTQNAFCKCANGEMVFGSTNGINIFNPKKIIDNFHVPPVYVIGYKRSGSDVSTDTSIVYKNFIELNWRENFFQFELAALDYNDPTKNKYSYKLENYDKDWSTPTNVRYVSYTELPGGDYVFKVKASNNDGIWNETPMEIYIRVIPPFWKTIWFYVLVSVFGLIGIVTFTQYRTRAIKRENKVLEQKVEERTKELAEKNRDITSSIEYAKRIQEAILPSKEHIYESLKNAFILYKPKDIVSGDFYWFGLKNNYKIMAAVDCTGHGVPGAFMSMIGHNLLNQIVQERGVTDPGEILNNLHKGIQQALKQGQNQVNTNDGMDVSLVAINSEKNEVKWAGAFRPLIIVRANGTLEKIDGNKFPVGGAQLDIERIFTTQNLTMNKNDSIYMTSDGYADQFGGEKGKKFMVKKLNEILCNIHLQDMNGQKNRLNNEIEQWRGNHEQVDDILVVGIRF